MDIVQRWKRQCGEVVNTDHQVWHDRPNKVSTVELPVDSYYGVMHQK